MSHEEKAYISGTTVRLMGEFFTYEGLPVDVTNAKIVIYDYKYNQVLSQPLQAENKIGVGRYQFDYPTEAIANKKYIYEFYGELDGKPVINRHSFTTKFIF